MLKLLLFILLAHNTGSLSAASPDGSPSKNKKIFILAGQSNMSGHGGVFNGTWNGVVPPQCLPSSGIHRLDAELQWEEAVEPLHKGIYSIVLCGIGPGIAFAHSLLDSDPTTQVVGLVPCAVGGTKMSQWARGSLLYNHLLRRAMASVVGGEAIQGMLWYQGESDAMNLEDAELYQYRLAQIFTGFRSDLGFPELPIIQVALASAVGPYINKVREAQLGLKLANVRCVDAIGLQLEPDQLHLNTASQVRLGKMLADAFLDITRE